MDELTTTEVADMHSLTISQLTGWRKRVNPPGVRLERGKLLWSPQAVSLVEEYRRSLHPATRTKLRGEAEAYWLAIQMAGDLQRLAGRFVSEATVFYSLVSRFKPSVTAFIHTLPTDDHILIFPVGVIVAPAPGRSRKRYRASLAELNLTASGKTQDEAVKGVRDKLWSLYLTVREDPGRFPVTWPVVKQIIIPCKVREAT